jgi:hypothetical protein
MPRKTKRNGAAHARTLSEARYRKFGVRLAVGVDQPRVFHEN